MRIIAVGKRTLAALAVFGVTAGASALWAGDAVSDGCCGGAACAACDQSVVKTALTTPASADVKPAAGTPQTTCPIQGGKIDKKVFADSEGKRVYFCCAGCIAKFQKDPAKYIKAMEDAGIVLDKTPQPATVPPAPKS